MVSPQDLSAYEEAMSLGATGVEVVTIPRPRNYSKSTTEVKEKSLAVRAMKRENTREQQKTIIALEAINVKREFLCVVIFGIIMTFITLALASIAFGLPEWRLYKVGVGRVGLEFFLNWSNFVKIIQIYDYVKVDNKNLNPNNHLNFLEKLANELNLFKMKTIVNLNSKLGVMSNVLFLLILPHFRFS